MAVMTMGLERRTMREKGVLVRAAWAREMPVSSAASSVSSVATVVPSVLSECRSSRPLSYDTILMAVSVSLSGFVREPRQKITRFP
jgi:hypothetical protein